ncbi:acyltransferase [Mucilaginibacter sp.]|uniref:acyltransferase n=1 Tax=Mucilaginibacter sp. TaxID=1882438 RepID=UPI0032660E70
MKSCGKKNIVLNPLLITYQYLATGDKVFIRDGARIEGVPAHLNQQYNPLITIGNNVSIEQNLHLTCANKIIIGSNTAIAANVTISDINHPYTDITLAPDRQPLEVSSVTIGNDCKIYNNVVILPGTVLGLHTVVAANSVVLGKTYPDYCVLAGTPARIIKQYSFDNGVWESVPATKPINEQHS